MNSKLIMLLAAIALVVGVLIFMNRSSEANLSLTASAAKASFASDESVVIDLQLSNAGGKTCVSDMVPGSLEIVSLRRDGEDVNTRSAPSYFITSFPKMLESSLLPLGSGENLDITLSSSFDEGLSAQALHTTASNDTRGVTTFYDVGAPGTYELELMYRYPGPTSPNCTSVFDGNTNTAIVNFEITS